MRPRILTTVAAAASVVMASATLASAQPPNLPDDMGAWVVTGAMSQSREGGGAGNGILSTVLADGRVLTAGGSTTQFSANTLTPAEPRNYLSRSEIYDPAKGQWTPTGSLNRPRVAAALATLPSGKVLAAGGFGGVADFHKSAELYDPATGTWSFTGAMKVCRAGPAASRLPGGKVLLTGGLGCLGSSVSSAEIYDAATGVWSLAAPMKAARQGHSASTLTDGRILVAGGRATDGAVERILASAEVYDPAKNTWVAVDDMKQARAFHSAGTLQAGKVLVAGGRCPGQYVVGSPPPTECKTDTAEIFDPGSSKWSSTGSMTSRRIFAGSLVLRSATTRAGAFVVAGGSGQPSAEIYDPAAGKWAATPPPGQVRDNVQLVQLRNGDILMPGGSDATRLPYRRVARTAELFKLPQRLR